MNRAERDEFVGKLDRWKHEGCSVLVVGEVLDLLRETSDLLLGDDDRERYRVVVATDADPDAVAELLGGVSTPDRRARLLDYRSTPRSAAVDRGGVDRVPEVPVSGDLDRLYAEFTATLEAFDDDLPSGALRASVDTLRPLLRAYDRDRVAHWLTHVGNAAKSYRGIAHYLLPKPYTSETVQHLQGHVDAVIEVGTYDDPDADRKERWHVPGADLTTPWRPMDDATRGAL